MTAFVFKYRHHCCVIGSRRKGEPKKRDMKPVQVRCTILDAWGWCTGTTQRDGMEREEGGAGGGGLGLGTRVHPWQMHIDVWQNQYNIVK